MEYQIGQYRFQGSNTCISPVSCEPLDYKESSISGGEISETSFKDLIIQPTVSDDSGGFKENTDYYLFLKIPQDMNYDMTFDVKLIKQESGGEIFQFLKTVSITRGGSSNNVYNVVLYETKEVDYVEEIKDEETGDVIETITHYKVAAMIPIDYQVGMKTVKNYIYVRKDAGKDYIYYLGTGDTQPIKYDKYNDVSIVASWREEVGDNYGTFELVFRPVESGFSQIILEMNRRAEDYNIQRYDPETGITEYGRKVDKDQVSFELYEINNLLESSNGIGQGLILSKIGVWSRSGLMMAINGEEIRVGPSGYYELDAVPVESLGVVAKNYKDNFTIDYQYKVNQEDDD